MDEIMKMLDEIKENLKDIDEKIDAVNDRLDEMSNEIAELSKAEEAGQETFEELNGEIQELADRIESLCGPGPDDSITDICNKLSVIIRGAGYEDDTLGLGCKLVDDEGRELIITKYDSEGIEVEYVDELK